jgi:hypothetical protein
MRYVKKGAASCFGDREEGAVQARRVGIWLAVTSPITHRFVIIIFDAELSRILMAVPSHECGVKPTSTSLLVTVNSKRLHCQAIVVSEKRREYYRSSREWLQTPPT